MEPDKENRNPHRSWTPKRRKERRTIRSKGRRERYHEEEATLTPYTDRPGGSRSDPQTPYALPTTRIAMTTPLFPRTPAQTRPTPLKSIKEYRKRIANSEATYADPPLTMYPRQKKPRYSDPTGSYTRDGHRPGPSSMQITSLISPSSAKSFHRNFTEAMELCDTEQDATPGGPAPAVRSNEALNTLAKSQGASDKPRITVETVEHPPTILSTVPNRNNTGKANSGTRGTAQDRHTTLNCLLINARSVKKHKYEFRDTPESHNPDSLHHRDMAQ